MIGDEYQIYHDNDDLLGREIDELNSDFFMAQSSQTGQVACNPSTLSPFSRTLQMSVYNSATAPTVPSEDRTCYVGANAGLTGYTDWETVFEDQFSVDSGPSGTGVWYADPFAAIGNYKWAGGFLQFRVTLLSPFASSILLTGGGGVGAPIPVAVMKTDRPARITFKISTTGFLDSPTIQVSAGQKLTGQTDGIIRTAPGTYSQVYPTTGDGVLLIYCTAPVTVTVHQCLIEWIVVEQLPSSTVSQGTSISVGLNGQGIGDAGSADPEIGGAVGNDGLAQLGSDILSNPFMVTGLRIVSQFQELFDQLWTIRYTQATGRVKTITWQPKNFISDTNANAFVVDAPEFQFPIDGNLSICTRTPYVQTTSEAYWVIIFTVSEEVNNSGHIFFNQPLQKAKELRPTGNPIVALLNSKK